MSFWSRLRKTFVRERHDAEIDEEIQFHLAMKTREGYDPRESRLRFGNPAAIREQTRAMGMFEWLESLAQDARYGLRQLRRTPALTFSVILSLVVGIGANTAIFSIVNAALLQSLPVADPQSLQIVDWVSQAGWPKDLCNSHSGSTDGVPTGRVEGSSFSPRLYRALAREQTFVDSLMGFSDDQAAGMVVHGQAPERAHLQYVSTNFFQGLGVPPVLGRAFVSSDDVVGGEPVVVISHQLWLRSFGGSLDVLDQTLQVNNVVARIVGVAPPRFYGIQMGQWIDVYAPLAARLALNPRESGGAARGEDDGYWWVRLIARLKPGTTAEAASGQLSALYQRLVVPGGVKIEPAAIPTLAAHTGWRGFDPIGDSLSKPLWILMLLVGLILLMVCGNVANLLLSRAVARQHESAVRLALGAARLRLLRQQLVESSVIALLAGGIGLAAGYVLASWVQSFVRSGREISGFNLQPDLHVLAFTAGVSILTAFVFGLAPALHAARADSNRALQTQRRTILAGRLRLPRALVVVQIALCLTVLVAAGLLGRSLANLKRLDVGFDRDNLVYASVNPWRGGYEAEQVGPYVDRLRAELVAEPGIQSVATIGMRLLAGSSSSTTAHIPGRPYRNDGSDGLMLNRVSDGLLETLRIPLLLGRTFEPRDMTPGARAAIVDESFVERFFPDRNPLGQRFGTGPEHDDRYEIVGVVRNSRYNSLRDRPRPTMYEPFLPGERAGSDVNLVIRASIDLQQVTNAVRRVADSIDPDVPVFEVVTQTELADRRLLQSDRLLSILSSAFGVVALLLAAIGLAGLLAYAVARRTNEIGVRMALGAAPGDVVRMVLGDSLWMVAVGVLVGLPGAYAVGRLLKSMLFGLEPADPWTAAGALAVLAAVAAVAAWLPARRAARIDPMAALREE